MVKHRRLEQNSLRIFAFATALTISMTLASSPDRARAAELAEQAHSLRVVPVDAAFYSASLRLKEQLDIFLESKTYQRLNEIGLVQIGKAQLMLLWQQAAMPQVAEFRQYVESPEGQDAIALLQDMFSEEMFVYGSSDVADALAMFTAVNSMSRQARIEALAGGEDAEDVVQQRTMDVLAEHIEKFKIPTLVMGWRIEDGERAERQLDAVHSLARNLLDEHRPELSPHLQRDQIGGREFLTLRLDGSMIPWDEISEDVEDAEEVERWRELVSDKTLAVALGVTDEFVLLSVGETTDHLETFGQGRTLSEQPAIVRLNKHADQRVASVGYVSKELAQKLSSPEQTVEDLAGMAEEVLVAAEVSEEQREQLVADIRGLGSEFKKYMPEPGDVAGVSFLTSRGYEGFRYQAGAQPMWDSSKQLTLTGACRRQPAVVPGGAFQGEPRRLRAGRGVGEANRRASGKDRGGESACRGLGQVSAVPRSWRRAARAIGPGQPRTLHTGAGRRAERACCGYFGGEHTMGESNAGVAQAVADVGTGVCGERERCRAFATRHRGSCRCCRGCTGLAREINPEEVPEFDVPDPEKRSLEGGGTVYVYSLPEEWGLDAKVAFNAGLTDTTVVASWSPETTERLLKTTELDIDTSLKLDRPAAVVAHFQFAKLIDSIRPWIDYGFEVATGKLKVEEEEDGDDESEDEANTDQAAIAMQMGFIIPQVQQFLEVSTALQSFSSVTYEEDGLWVTHSEVHLEDLK